MGQKILDAEYIQLTEMSMSPVSYVLYAWNQELAISLMPNSKDQSTGWSARRSSFLSDENTLTKKNQLGLTQQRTFETPGNLGAPR